MLTFEDIPDMVSHAARAADYVAGRFGERTTIGRRQAIDLARHGWGIAAYATVAEVEASFDAAAGGEVPVARTATFRAAYSLPAGHSAGGSSMSSRPVSCPMFALSDVMAWAERALIRFACSADNYSHIGA